MGESELSAAADGEEDKLYRGVRVRVKQTVMAVAEQGRIKGKEGVDEKRR